MSLQSGAEVQRFKDKYAVVTGGSSGIGRATVERLCAEGAAVLFTSNEEEIGNRAEQEMLERGWSNKFLHGDMAEASFHRKIADAVQKLKWHVDYIVNNAFSFIAKGADASEEDWDTIMRVGPIAYAGVVQALLPLMEGRNGAIVNVSSISAFIAQPNRWTYNAAKGAVHTLTKCMALDLAPLGIRVNSVSPGWIWTREVDKAAGGDRKRWEPIWGQFHMLERCGEPAEVANAILFLLSGEASFITAADLPVDGGYQGLGSEGLGKSSSFAGSK
jgi:NAD(P)-dependent dehydrogenase (short-subunit alcohol dehydrogenase family)